ncbi:N-acetyl-gamma-glutamyl-phosphate reductase [Staphylococcus aureus]|uniref:N-acetyl-gamma-glutamyl-phosphate reductase n=1 Tax=Staphylococcus aureus TaxID=1280 RepID=UPI000E3E079E|nr:N-acetyl-gamma-glutamyl-phosphate reductase [Staphylococcus aureus]GBV56194.1 putative N-acetyl-gamma-glutamyl-phosphate reductase [Staphylococcus aureus]
MIKQREVAILGGTGFVGMELFRLLQNHPFFRVTFISSESMSGKSIINQHTLDRKMKYQSIDSLKNDYDAIFSCLPSGVLPNYINKLLNKSEVIFNVSGDYRLNDKTLSNRYYPATEWENLNSKVQYYIPEFTKIDRDKKIINLGGCMAVSSIYSLYPLIKHNLIENNNIILDVKTGSSGGGKTTKESHAERFNNFRIHKVFEHKHQPEIVMFLNTISQNTNNVNFSAFSLDIPRGIYVSSYTNLKQDVTEIDVKKAYFQTYKESVFIDYISNINKINLKQTLGTNQVYTSFKLNKNLCLSVSMLDNLVKGAAGQAIQAANNYFNIPESEGLSVQKGAMWP